MNMTMYLCTYLKSGMAWRNYVAALGYSAALFQHPMTSGLGFHSDA